jgi:acyl-coenzyme A synthetase/AMP-(fatty) acid ligase
MLSVHADALPPPCPAPFNLAAHVLAHAPALGDAPALEWSGGGEGAEIWSYARLEAAVRGCAAGLRALGLPEGGRVILRLGNTPVFPVAFLAAIAAGLVPVPTSAQLTAPEITAMAAGLDPVLVLADPGIAVPEATTPVLMAAEFLAMAALPPADYAQGDPERLAYVIFTSGSSGRPRAVAHAHRAIWARRMMTEGWYGLRAGDRVLHAGAFNWSYTLGTGLMDPWAAGATALIPAPGVMPAALAGLLAASRASIFAAAPGVYRQMLRENERLNLPDLRHGLSAGEALPPALAERWTRATGRQIHAALGMSECSTFISGSPARPAPTGSTGYPQPGRHIAVLDAAGAPVPRGSPGELAVHESDPGLYLGYLGAPEETAARRRGPWFITGDTVCMAADGAVSYLGRQDDMMNAGGYRVSPLEVEAAMAQAPGAGEVAAVELAVKEDVTVIALFHTGPALPETLADHAAGCLARYKQPRLYRRVTSLPRNPNGKIDRRALRNMPPPAQDETVPQAAPLITPHSASLTAPAAVNVAETGES